MKQRIVWWVWVSRVLLFLILVPVLSIAMYGGLPDMDCTEGADGARIAVWFLISCSWCWPASRQRDTASRRRTGSDGEGTRLASALLPRTPGHHGDGRIPGHRVHGSPLGRTSSGGTICDRLGHRPQPGHRPRRT